MGFDSGLMAIYEQPLAARQNFSQVWFIEMISILNIKSVNCDLMSNVYLYSLFSLSTAIFISIYKIYISIYISTYFSFPLCLSVYLTLSLSLYHCS